MTRRSATPRRRGALPGSTHQTGRRVSPLHGLVRAALIRIMAKSMRTADIAAAFGVDRSYIIRIAAAPFRTRAVTDEEQAILAVAKEHQNALVRQGFGFLFRDEHYDPGPVQLMGARERGERERGERERGERERGERGDAKPKPKPKPKRDEGRHAKARRAKAKAKRVPNGASNGASNGAPNGASHGDSPAPDAMLDIREIRL